MEAITCVNFCWRLKGFPPCQSMWCASCYSSNHEVKFHVRSKPGLDDEEERIVNSWKRSVDHGEYHSARDGDHLITPFECDLCIFVKLKGRYPMNQNQKDRKLAACIRRVNLDAFWSRASTTVSNNLRLVKRLNNLADEVGLESPFVSYGPMPDEDHCGYQLAISMVLMSTRAGRYDKSYTQFETIRHLRSCLNSYDKISSGSFESLRLEKSSNQDAWEDRTASIWFRRFYSGCRARMGQISKPNLVLTTALIVRLLEEVRNEITRAEDRSSKFDLVVFGSYVTISYLISLRGSEGLMIDLAVINRELEKDRDCCMIGLKGRVKGESVDRDHLFPCSKITSSGINVLKWLQLLSAAHKMAGRTRGSAITTWNGEIVKVGQLDSRLHEMLSWLFEERFEFPAEIKSVEDIYERFSVFRSLRRGSNTRALNQNISANDIDVVNRWKTVETAKGSKPHRSMRQHYAEISDLKAPFLRYTAAM